MRNYLKHISQEIIWLLEPKQMEVIFSGDARSILFNRKVMDT